MAYVQHEYALNQPWTLNSNNTEMSSVLDGDEELLILDNSRLAIDDEFDNRLDEDEQDFCRCVNCLDNNRANCLSKNNNNTDGIAIISSGDILDEVNHWNRMSSSSNLEPSSQTYPHRIDEVDHSSGHNHSHNHSHNGHTTSDQIWVHCHPTQLNTSASSAVSKANRQLIIGCVLCLVFMIAEVIGGFISNSLAIMTDAAHLLSDLASFLLSLFAIWISQKRPTKKMSFGFYRAEVLGAVTSIFMIWVLTGILVYLAIDRIKRADYEINTEVMLIVSGLGIAMNIVMGLTLADIFSCGKRSSPEENGHGHGHGHGHSHSHGHSHGMSHGHSHANMNVRAALIHVLGDLIQSIGVLIAALIIHFKPEYRIADPICTFIFSGLVMFTTFGIMKDAVHVLMEGFPSYLDYSAVKKDLVDIVGVQAVHSLHIWSLTMSRNALSVHLAIDGDADPERVLKLSQQLIRKKYDIQQTTIQVERYDHNYMNNCLTCKGP